jgi:uracil-DNA glycosylase family 4
MVPASSADPKALGCNCDACPFNLNKKGRASAFVWAEIPKAPEGVLINEAPSIDDMKAGRPLTGTVAGELANSLKQAGLRRDRLAVMNSILCRPVPGADHNDMKQAVKCCSPALKHQMQGLEHLPKLLMGAGPAKAFGVKAAVDNARGFYREEINAVVTYTPGYAFFGNPFVWANFDSDVAVFARAVRGTEGASVPVINTAPSAGDVRRLAAGGRIAVDIETSPVSPDAPWTGKSPTEACLKSIGIGTPDEGIAIWWETVSPQVEEAIKEIFYNEAIVKVLHNGWWFDLPVLQRYGLEMRNVEDTRDMRRALSATSKLSLRYLGSVYCPEVGPWKEVEEADTGDDQK